MSGSIDGIQLGRFVTGLTYDVGTTLANYLLAEGVAVPTEETTPALDLPIHDVAEIYSNFTRAEAADRPPKKKSSRKKKR